MRRANILKIGIPLLVVVLGLVAALGINALGSRSGGPTEAATIKGTIEWTVYDSAGNIKEHKLIHNTVTTAFKEAASDRLKDVAFAGAAATTYDNITVCSTDAGATACTSAQLVANLGTALDTGTTNNPAEGAITDTAVDGTYVV